MRNVVLAVVVVIVVAAAAVTYFWLNPPTVVERPSRAEETEVAAAKEPDARVNAREEASPSAIETAPVSMDDAVKAFEALGSRGAEDIKLRTVRVYGTVTNAATGEPISGALVFTDAYAMMLDAASSPGPIEDERLALSGLTEQQFRTLLQGGETLPEQYQGKFGAANAKSDDAGAFSIVVSVPTNEAIYCRAKGFAGATHAIGKAGADEVRIDFQLRKGGSISGTVTNAADGAPVAGVVVRAKSGDEAQRPVWLAMQDGPSVSLYYAVTADDGSYTIDGLPEGHNALSVEDNVHGWLFDHARTANVSVAEAEAKTGVDLVVTQGLRVEGTIADEDGEPVADAAISSSSAESDDIMDFVEIMSQTKSARSDDAGHYVALGLRPGKSTIAVSHPDFAEASADVTVVAGETPEVLDFVLVKGTEVSGTAKYEDGSPAVEELLYLTVPTNGETNTPFDFKPGRSPMHAFTEEGSGVFVFTHVPAGEYVLSNEPFDYPGMAGQEASRPKVPVQVDGTTPVTGLQIVLPKEETFGESRGKIAGTVLGIEGSPAQNVSVRATSKEQEQFAGGGAIDSGETTDEHGAFTLERLYGTTFTVHAESENGEAVQENVKLGDTITLRLGPVTAVTGVVVDANGDAVAGCSVSLVKQEPGESESMAAMMEQMFNSIMPGGGEGEKSDDFGQFTFRHMEAGNYIVEAKSSGRGFGASDQFSVTKGTEKSGVRVVLEAGATFAGMVVDGAGNPVQGANVSLIESTGGFMDDAMSFVPAGMGPAPAAVATTGVDGAFSMSGLKPGTFTLSAKHADYAPYVGKNVEVSASSPPHRVTLGKGGSARGQFIAADGKPRGNVMIQFMGPNGMQMATTDSEGRFEVKGLPAGTYMVNPIDMSSMGRGGEEDAMPMMNLKSVEITEGGDVVIAFGTGVTVSGSVPEEYRGKMTMVYVMRKGAPDMASLFGQMESTESFDPTAAMEMGMQMMQYTAGMATAGEDGTFALPGIDPGEYELRVYASDFNMEDIDPEAYMNMSIEEMQEQSRQFMPKEVVKLPITVGDTPVAVEFPMVEAAP
ncbi:MAG: carboxypeptidase regulatory-like domain-containing protein [Candidatus Hydrogenedentes bacterium]|nr:carboxypeptidase regulatory-like domain-containing protein [Candidatus Hydrogenedentota bacterium]